MAIPKEIELPEWFFNALLAFTHGTSDVVNTEDFIKAIINDDLYGCRKHVRKIIRVFLISERSKNRVIEDALIAAEMQAMRENLICKMARDEKVYNFFRKHRCALVGEAQRKIRTRALLSKVLEQHNETRKSSGGSEIPTECVQKLW